MELHRSNACFMSSLHLQQVQRPYVCYWWSPIMCTRGHKNIGRFASRITFRKACGRGPLACLCSPPKTALGLEQRQLMVYSVLYVYSFLAM